MRRSFLSTRSSGLAWLRSRRRSMRYIKDRAVAADPWVYIVGDEPVPPDVPSIVTPDWLFAAAPAAVSGRAAPLGVAWPNDKPEGQLEPHLSQLSLVALDF